jgi:hypothetical protein
MRKSKSRSRSRRQKGGFVSTIKTTTTMPKTMHGAMPTKIHHKGGSPASSIVMSDCTMNPPVMNDYAGPDRIRDSWYDPSLSVLEPKCGGQSGGSLASNLVMEQLTQKPKTEPFDPAWSPKGDMNSLNLYETTGGARRRRKTRRASSNKRDKKRTSRSRSRNSRNKNSNMRKSKRNTKRNNRSSSQQRGGGSDWIMSQYSLGPYNNPEQPGSWVSQFSRSTATSRDDYMNPKTLGLAGSGYPMGSLEGANVSHVGAPIS